MPVAESLEPPTPLALTAFLVSGAEETRRTCCDFALPQPWPFVSMMAGGARPAAVPVEKPSFDPKEWLSREFGSSTTVLPIIGWKEAPRDGPAELGI